MSESAASASDQFAAKASDLTGFCREVMRVDNRGNRILERIAEWGAPPADRFLAVKRVQINLPPGVLTPDGANHVLCVVEFGIAAADPQGAFMIFDELLAKAIDVERDKVVADIKRWSDDLAARRDEQQRMVGASQERDAPLRGRVAPIIASPGRKLPPGLDANRTPHQPKP